MSRILIPLFVGAFAVACSGGDKGSSREEDTAPDTALDVFFPPDIDTAQPEETTPAETTQPDDTQSEVAIDVDPSVDCDLFGCTCLSNADCLDGLCIEGPDGFTCTKVCSLECPVGYDCLTTTAFGPDPLSVCVPRHVPLCRPCMAHTDCAVAGAREQAYCLPADDPDEGRFCATACGDDLACPAGYDCATVPLPGGAEARLCRPSAGLCQCRPDWSTEPYETTCVVRNDLGACTGRRSCGPEGLLPCDGPLAAPETCDNLDNDCDGSVDDIAELACTITRGDAACPGVTACDDGAEICVGQAPAAETCNGLDDDCDGSTDEGICDDGLACTTDTCNGSACVNELALDACLIDGRCVEAGTTSTTDPCLTCQPAVSSSAYSLAEGLGCDDFDACTSGDTCVAGTCAGTTYSCDDGLACTTDTCDGRGGCLAPLAPGNCLIAGVCYGDGQRNPSTPCQICDSSKSAEQWSAAAGVACDDGNACTSADTCAEGACHGTPYTCDDGDPCTSDACDGAGACTHDVAVQRCTIDGSCFAAGFFKPGDPCYVCDPSKSNTSWSPVPPGTACDDADACTADDACTGGVCRGTAYTCDDGLACTDESCDGNGGCAVELDADTCIIDGACVAADTRETPGGCRACVPAESDKAWTVIDGQPCDDGEACTSGDACQQEVCSGTGYLCDDGNGCTVDACLGDGTCSFTQATSTCIIAGACHAAGAIKPDERCLACRPEISPSQWSPVAAGTACDDGNVCTHGDACNAGACSGTAYTCSDGLACTTDACDGLGGCTATINAGTCLIDGVCRDAGALAATGGCLECDPLANNVDWSERDGEACDDGVACTQSDTCDGQTCGGTPYVCDDGIACTNDSCDGDGTCTFTRVDGVCLIAGVCYADGEQKPGEPCFACRPELSGTSWSPSQVGTECDDGNPCTSDDACANGLCAGDAYTCGDGLACTSDACDGDGGCVFSVLPNNCLIAGACVAAGTLQAAGGCRICDPSEDLNDWSPNDGAACNDQNACTADDTCLGTSCGGTPYACDDGLACTTDQCNGDGTCTNTLQAGFCVIGGACIGENTEKPGDVCLSCRPNLSTTDWRPVQNGKACNDGASCTHTDVCTGGVCFGTTYQCNDNRPCTSNVCNGDNTCSYPIDPGACLINGTCYDDGDTAGPGAQACLVCNSEISQQSWFPNDQAPCDDGLACTAGDACSGSTCGGAPYDCDDGNACTLDSCKGDGTCDNIQAADTCIIGGVCYAAGVAKPGEPCFACRPEISASAWSAVTAGSPCNDGNACTHTDQCNGGTCAGTAYTCDDGLSCTSDACNGAGGCTASINAGSCLIDGTCHANGALQTAGGCLVCNAAQSPTAWYPNSGASCNDGVACTSNDLCSGSTCGGTTYSCDDGLTCTNDSCDGDGTCTNAQVANTCLIAGVCYAANAVNAANPCLQCRPDLNPTTWSPIAGTVSCSDNNTCTHGDTCTNGSCVGTPYICNDGLTCTTDACLGDGTCGTTVNSGFCAINNTCYANGTTDPSNPCKVCNAAANPTGWSNKASGTNCNDNNSCTHTDKCNASGQCGGTSYSCNDGLSCTADSCDGDNTCTNTVTTGCRINNQCIAEGAFNPSNPCQQCIGSQSRTAWSPNTGNSCNDGQSCTHTDRCNNGTCGGTTYTCDDGRSCTSNNCNGTGGCSYPLISGNCLISGTCYTNNTTRPGNVCEKCNTSSSTSAWSVNNVSCNDGNSCTSGDFCSNRVCSGSPIVDAWESNNSRPGRRITDISDCASVNAHSLTGTIYASGDVDWYHFYDSDQTGCSMYPDVSLVNIPSGTDLDLDVYFRCGNGRANPISFRCVYGSEISGHGCRSQASGTASERVQIDACCTEDPVFGTNCTGDDSGWLDVRVYRFSGDPTCSQSYTLRWGDD